MNKIKQHFSLAILFLGATNFSQISLAQYNVPIQPPVPSHDIMFPQRSGNSQSVCYRILSSEWRYYQRMRASGGNYPDAEAVRLQRKWESKKGCPHLYEADGSVNRVRGIND
jgi:hypothetical protein